MAQVTSCDSSSCLLYPQPIPCSWDLPSTGYNKIVASLVPGGTFPSPSVEVGTEPVQGKDITDGAWPVQYPYTEWWYYKVSVHVGTIPAVGTYYVDVLVDDTQDVVHSCTPWVDAPACTQRLYLFAKPRPPECFSPDRGSRLGYSSDSFQGGGCGGSCSSGDFPWPSVVNPVVYAPVSAPGGLDGPAAGQFYTGRSGY